MMNEYGKSDNSMVTEKLPDKAGHPAAEAMEERELAKGNPSRQNASRTQSRIDARSALERIRQAVERDRKQLLTALFHHVYSIDMLRTAYYSLKRKAAAGVDGQTWQTYRENLEDNLQDLSKRLKTRAYRAKPVSRTRIPKPDGRR